jgi:hypothetical protein
MLPAEMALDPQTELRWLQSLEHDARLRFMAQLAYALTIAGRPSYKAGTTALEHPQRLRALNQLQHQVTACLSQMLAGEMTTGLDTAVAKGLFQTDAEVRPHACWAWEFAKQHMQPDS